MTTEARIERDTMGEVSVPAERYWGGQTERARRSFRIGEEKLPTALIHAYGLVKRAAAEVHAERDGLPPDLAQAIATAAQEVVDGTWDAEFPLGPYQTGSGTQTNMNLNEVIAHRANEILGAGRGSKAPIHPNDHVNRGQSTNDSFPTAMHVATVLGVKERLLPEVSQLREVLEGHARRFADVVKIGRTHLQDAIPLTLGQEISGWAAQLEEASLAIEASLRPVHALAIGGTAVGTGLNAPPGFGEAVADWLARATGHPFVSAPNKFSAMASHDALVGLSGALKQLACATMKIANDVRWLASGPRCGIGELRIPANEPGSSIMPGKVNPTQPEALTMVCCRVLGNDAAIGFAGTQGNFELNVFKPFIAHAILESIRILSDGVRSFRAHCAEGIEANRPRIAELLERSLMLVTALNPHIGYDRAAEVAKKAYAEDLSLKEAVLALGYLDEATFDQVMRPERMARPEGS